MSAFKFPKKVLGLAGPITVRFKGNPTVKGEVVAGYWRTASRLIVVSSSIEPRQQVHTYFHELVHAALDDSGQCNLLTDEGQEALCDLIATARLLELGL
jgi:Zn-dependent peptidase ImmA (M78 family)